MTDEGIRLEYEMFLAAQGRTLFVCDRCGVETYEGGCPVCVDGPAPQGEIDMERLIAKIQAGEDVDIETELGKDKGV